MTGLLTKSRLSSLEERLLRLFASVMSDKSSVLESSNSSPSSHESSPSLLGGLDRKTLVILKLVAFLFVGMSSPSMGGMEARSFGSVITG